MNPTTILRLALPALIALACNTSGAATTGRYIVSAHSATEAAAAVRHAGGQVVRPIALIDGVLATLTPAAASALAHKAGIHVSADREVKAGDDATPATNSAPVAFSPLLPAPPQAAEIGASALHAAGITGKGVTIAMIDSGMWTFPAGSPYAYDNWNGRIAANVDLTHMTDKPYQNYAVDRFGHGTHVTSIAASAARDSAGQYYGIAPGAKVIALRAINTNGGGSYSQVIWALDWVVSHKDAYGIRVVNLSLGAKPQSYYWDDPLAQAVMRTWKAGIVVVVAAGNSGPRAQSINVPGNVPYVITVGAMTDNHTPFDPTDDRLTSFSSTGPTYEGFVKPEIVAPGGHILATMPNDLADVKTSLAYRVFQANNDSRTLFPLSGTSMAAAVTSGAVALLLQAQPNLTPDEVKCKLMATARVAVQANGTPAYSVFQQGNGSLDVLAASTSSATGCANRGLDIAADLAGTAHFGGPANRDAKGNYYVMDMQNPVPLAADGSPGTVWSGKYSYGQGFTWGTGFTWSRSTSWTKGFTWSRSGTWNTGFTWSRSYSWSSSLSWPTDSPPTGAGAATTSKAGAVAFPAREE